MGLTVHSFYLSHIIMLMTERLKRLLLCRIVDAIDRAHPINNETMSASVRAAVEYLLRWHHYSGAPVHL